MSKVDHLIGAMEKILLHGKARQRKANSRHEAKLNASMAKSLIKGIGGKAPTSEVTTDTMSTYEGRQRRRKRSPTQKKTSPKKTWRPKEATPMIASSLSGVQIKK